MKRILLLSMVFSFVFATSAWAQRTVSGKVTDESGEGLPGVNVVIKGTTTGVTTNLDGSFSIEVPDGGVLVFTSVGMASQEVNVGARSVIDISMAIDATELQEIVVTGQGAGISKSRIATTVDVVTAKDLEYKPLTRIDQVLQASLPSTQIQMSSGDPGTSSIVRSRGIASAALSTTPIIYIDGVRVDNLNTASSLNIGTGGAQSSALADIPVESIERIEFVKGGAATTLYGADAGNGVIQIFTKKGQAGKARFTFETQQGVIKGTSDYFKYDQTGDIVFRNGWSKLYRVGASGGSDKVTYNFSGSVYGDNSYREGIENQRYSLRTTLNAALSEKLNLQTSFGLVANDYTRLPNANTSFDRSYGIEQGLLGIPGLSTVDPSQYTSADVEIVKALIDGVARLADISEKTTRFQNSQMLTYNPIDKVTINTTFGVDYSHTFSQDITTNEYLIHQLAEAPGTTDQGSISTVDRNFLSTTAGITVQYQEEVGDFSFITVGGGQFFKNNDRQIRLDATNVTEGSRSLNNSSEVNGQDFIQTVTNYGYFGKENIGYKDRYFVDFGFRVDYNTAFGTDIGGQFFPSFGASYVISNESFFAGLSSVVSFMKLRGTYGEAGNFPQPFARDANLNVNPFLGGTAVQISVPPAADLVPERVKTTEVGFDARFLKDRISASVTYFDSKTEDALFTAPFAPSFGLDARVRNLGIISNKGWEVVTSFNIIKNQDFDLTTTFSVNTVENVVESTGGAAEFSVGGFSFLGNFVKEGLPVGYMRSGKPVFASDGSLESFTLNANVGKPLPDMFGSMSINLTYKKRWNLYAQGDYQTGGNAVNTNEVLRFFRGLDDDRIPAASKGESFFNMGGVWIESSDYLKIRNISLSYLMPDEWLGGTVKNVQVTFTALNPFNFFKATNFDPETTGAGARGQNQVNVGAFGYGTFSAPRQFLGSIKFNF